jgi:hypothetical protein
MATILSVRCFETYLSPLVEHEYGEGEENDDGPAVETDDANVRVGHDGGSCSQSDGVPWFLALTRSL